MPSIRECSKCSEPTLNPIERKLGIYNSTLDYKCTNCGEETELVPLGSLGVQMCIYLLVALIVWFIFIGNSCANRLYKFHVFSKLVANIQERYIPLIHPLKQNHIME